MTLDLDVVGRPGRTTTYSWDQTAVNLYALGVGAGAADPLVDLAYTTEGAGGVPPLVLPSFATIVSHTGRPYLGEYDHAMLVHAAQEITLHRPLTVTGTATRTPTVTAIHDKGSGALIEVSTEVADAESGEALVSSRSSLFIKGEGGFGGPRGPSTVRRPPEGEPDQVARVDVAPSAALIYRLSGDRNPLHVDPAIASRAGYARPILHGLCTYGITCRVLVAILCEGDPGRLHSMAARFTSPTWPGDPLTVSVWLDGATATFQTSRDDGTVVLGQGTALTRSA